MNNVFQLSKRSLDQLEHDLISLAAHMNAKEYEFLVSLREFDIRQGWKEYHFNHCSEWLNMMCGIDVSTGREKVRVARALLDLPVISAAFAEGRLSYTKARSLTRVATPQSEGELVDYALRASANHVQEHCRRLRNADRARSTADANTLHRNRRLFCSIDANGRMTLSVDLPAESGQLVMIALERALAAAEAERANASEGPRPRDSLAARQADALVDVATAYLEGGGEKGRHSPSQHYQVMVHVDARALRANPVADGLAAKGAVLGAGVARALALPEGGAGLADASRDGLSARGSAVAADASRDGLSARGSAVAADASYDGLAASDSAVAADASRDGLSARGFAVAADASRDGLAARHRGRAAGVCSDLPIETVRRLCCDSAVAAIVEDRDRNPLYMGRSQRVVSPKQQKALRARDRSCAYPGCRHDRWLAAHHIRHWIDGGETDIDNLVLLCGRHHRLLHEGGYRIKRNHRNELYFETNKGRVVASAPRPPPPATGTTPMPAGG